MKEWIASSIPTYVPVIFRVKFLQTRVNRDPSKRLFFMLQLNIFDLISQVGLKAVLTPLIRVIDAIDII